MITRRFIVRQDDHNTISASLATSTRLNISYATSSCNWEPYMYMDISYQPTSGSWANENANIGQHPAHVYMTRLLGAGAQSGPEDSVFELSRL